MITKRNLLLTGTISLFIYSIGNAQIIYSKNFAAGGATNIWETAPTMANNFAGGISSATWRDALGTKNTGSLLANGTDNTTQGDSWLLPFNPQSGYVYTLTASLTFTANPGNWVGLGFAQNDSTNEAVGPGSTTNTVNATVNFSPTNIGLPLNPAFGGLSYEKANLTKNFFSSNNIALVKLFSQIGPAVLRIGGGTADLTCWGGLSNLPAITPSQVDVFAGFIKALPTNWSVIYGINFSVNNPTNCAAEAAYVANALGSRLLGFEIGNEPEAYPWNGIRPSNFTYSDFISQWRPLAAAVTNAVPGWTLTGPASGGNTNYTISFANDEAGVASLTTQHYYRADGTQPGSTMQLLLQPDPKLPGTVSRVVSAVKSANLSLGFREDECGSYSHGGVVGVSDAYGAALWSLDFMFTLALNGCEGLNFHGGGRSPYTPLYDNGTTVQQVRPEFYGLKMFSLLPRGNVVPATVTLTSVINFTAYGVRCAAGGISALLNNKDTNDKVVVIINLGPNVAGAQLIELTGPSLFSTNAYKLGGSPINPDGSWSGGVQEILSATNGLLTVVVPPISAILLNPILTPPAIAFSVNSSQLSLNWPTNYTGWLLQSNSIALATTNWFSVLGSGNTNQMQITIQPGHSNVFYRLSLL
jgi:hypothetical protein